MPRPPARLVVAATAFFTADATLAAFLASLTDAAGHLTDSIPDATCRLVVVDNSPGGQDRARLEGLLAAVPDLPGLAVSLLSGHGNVGFGAANNLALLKADGDVLIVANPDLILEPDALTNVVTAFAAFPEAGLLSPCFTENGRPGHLCKRYPSFAVLFGRGFLLARARHLMAGLFDRYRMADQPPDRDFWDPPIVSGAFMAFRAPVFRALGGFDERYFLYFEDFDISLRSAAFGRIRYVSTIRMAHAGGHTARRGLKLIRHFAASAVRFWLHYGFRLVAVKDYPPRHNRGPKRA